MPANCGEVTDNKKERDWVYRHVNCGKVNTWKKLMEVKGNVFCADPSCANFLTSVIRVVLKVWKRG